MTLSHDGNMIKDYLLIVSLCIGTSYVQVAGLHSTIGRTSDCRLKFKSQLGCITSMEIDHEIRSTVIVSHFH